jgi:hypothetical protein
VVVVVVVVVIIGGGGGDDGGGDGGGVPPTARSQEDQKQVQCTYLCLSDAVGITEKFLTLFGLDRQLCPYLGGGGAHLQPQ